MYSVSWMLTPSTGEAGSEPVPARVGSAAAISAQNPEVVQGLYLDGEGLGNAVIGYGSLLGKEREIPTEWRGPSSTCARADLEPTGDGGNTWHDACITYALNKTLKTSILRLVADLRQASTFKLECSIYIKCIV